MVTVDSKPNAGRVTRAAPPSRGSISFVPMNHASSPGPVAMASQTSSGVASSSSSFSTLKGWVMSGLLSPGGGRLDARVDGHDNAVVAAPFGLHVVVLGHQGGDGGGELLGEGRAVGCG